MNVPGSSVRPLRSSEADETATELDLPRRRIRDLYKVYMQEEYTCSIEEQSAAIQEIGHLAWLGNNASTIVCHTIKILAKYQIVSLSQSNSQ